MINDAIVNKNISLTALVGPREGGVTEALLSIIEKRSADQKIVVFESQGAMVGLAQGQTAHNIAVFDDATLMFEDTKRIILTALEDTGGDVAFAIDDIAHVVKIKDNPFPERGFLKFINFLNEVKIPNGKHIHIVYTRLR